MATTKKKAATKKSAATSKARSAKRKTARAATPTARSKRGLSNKKTVARNKKTSAKKQLAPKPPPRKLPASKRTTPSKKVQTAGELVELSSIPPGLVARYSTTLCLACIFDLFTRRLGIAPRTAYTEIRRHSPAIEELTTKNPERPYFRVEVKNQQCPYCHSAKRWHARLDTWRVEGGRATDAPRRAFVKTLPSRDDGFQVLEKKSTARAVFFEWLEHLGRELDFDGSDHLWMMAAARAYLERHDPKTDWAEVFAGVRQVRRSRRLEEGWERDGARLFLPPAAYNDVLLVQYLVSRSHRHGGRTFEGRQTLTELVRRMRLSGHLEAQGITDRDQFDVLEKLVEQLTGGDAPLKLHYIVDRRDLLEKVRDVYARYA